MAEGPVPSTQCSHLCRPFRLFLRRNSCTEICRRKRRRKRQCVALSTIFLKAQRCLQTVSEVVRNPKTALVPRKNGLPFQPVFSLCRHQLNNQTILALRVPSTPARGVVTLTRPQAPLVETGPFRGEKGQKRCKIGLFAYRFLLPEYILRKSTNMSR